MTHRWHKAINRYTCVLHETKIIWRKRKKQRKKTKKMGGGCGFIGKILPLVKFWHDAEFLVENRNFHHI